MNEELKRMLAVIEGKLVLASKMLKRNGDWRQFDEYIKAGELGLAFEELEDIASEQIVTKAFTVLMKEIKSELCLKQNY